MAYNKILIIQTSYIGDVVLATSLIAKLKQYFPDSRIDFLLKKGNEELLENDPSIHRVISFDKSKFRISELLRLWSTIRTSRYDLVVNVHRFLSSGILAILSRAKVSVGFEQNPMSRFYSKRIKHEIGDGKHEINRNQELIAHLTDEKPLKPYLHLTETVLRKIEKLGSKDYVTISPSSIWYTKQLPKDHWISLLNASDFKGCLYFLGAKSDFATCEFIRKSLKKRMNSYNMCGELTMLESAALMKSAAMNYVNDSAPLHFASAVNAPTAAVFCSTVPAFGFGPLSDNSTIIEVKEPLACRPCGLHGHNSCPKKDFQCARNIAVQDLLDAMPTSR